MKHAFPALDSKENRDTVALIVKYLVERRISYNRAPVTSRFSDRTRPR
ncbi:MAG: hypothetical protein M1336_02270 [Deltaproteobacteria bacterium]|jgi:hypothetical protein|nr:hypothetical protein [Deltaproteobacteria bacterium]